MKKLILYRLVRCIATYHFLSSLVVFLLLEVNGASGKSSAKTKLLLQNIRTHLTQKPDEIVKEKECGLGLILCKNLKPTEKEGEEERSKEIGPPPKLLRPRPKPLIKVKPKSLVQTVLPKRKSTQKSLFRGRLCVNRGEFLGLSSGKPHQTFQRITSTVTAIKDLHRRPQKGGKNGSYWKFIRSPDAVSFSQADDKSVEKTFGKDDAPFQESKRPRDPVKQPLGNIWKIPTSTDARSPKAGRRDEPALQNVKKTPRRKAKLEGKEIATKIRRPWMKEDKKTSNAEKGKRGAEAKAAERRSVEEAFTFPNEPFVFVLDADNAQRNVCRKHSQFYLKQLQKQEMWALTMYDASGKFSSGILRGNSNQYGDFDECLSVNVVFKKSKKKWKSSSGIKGKYCLANIDVSSESKSTALRKIQERIESFRFVKSTVHDPGHFIPRFSTINWGLCVPSACLAEDVEKFLKSRFDFFNNASGLVFDVKVEEDNCVMKDDLEFEFHSQTAVTALLYLTVLSLSLYATYFDAEVEKSELSRDEKLERELEEAAKDITVRDKYQTRQEPEKKAPDLSLKGKGKRLVAAFSLKKNVDKLLTDKNRGNIECINGIKSIFTIMLYFAHKTIPLAMTPFSNRVALTKISNQPITVLLRASIVYTDSFLLISGMLTAYGLAKEVSEKKEISWTKKAIGRFIRLTPPLLAVVLFYAYIWDQMGSGPTWNLIVRRNSLLCRRYMWRNLLYIQNIFQFENMCAPQTHQLALDMQLSLLAPLFVHLMHKHDKVGIGALQALFILSSIMRYITTFNNNLSVVIYHGMPVAQLYKTANLLYAQALYRASPYILGTVVGYHLKKFENQLNFPKAFAALGWMTALSFGYYSLASPSRLASRSYQYNVQEAAQYAALSPVAWSLALSWVIAACHLGFGGKLNEFLCHKIFLVFSRISYSVYLTQFLVFFYDIGVKKIPEMFTFGSSFGITEFITVIVVSVIITLLFDIPAMEIKKIILDEKGIKTLLKEPHDLSETTRLEDEPGSETISGEDSQENSEELSGDIEDEGGDEDEMEDGDVQSGNDESNDEAGHDDDEMIEAVFEIRPLKRSSRMHFSDESEDK